MQSYADFLQQKRKSHIQSGFNPGELSHGLFPFQKHVVTKALRSGKYAIFSGCGTGKTPMQLVWAEQVYNYTKKPVLILAPLAVSGQTIQEGKKFNIDVRRYDGSDFPIQISNYEQIDNIDVSIFAGIVLDESSILKNYMGSYRNIIIDKFKHTPFKLACTATPSPNDPMELGNHAEFLDVMSSNEMLAMYFNHDGSTIGKWRIKGHAYKIFWNWVASWSIMFQHPKDIGFNQDGYDLPKLNLIEKQIITGQRHEWIPINSTAVSATNFNQELRLTKVERLEQAAQIVNESKEQFVIWIKQNEEGEMIRKLIPDAIEVSGSDTNEYKEEMLLGFAANKFRVIVTKGKIASFGMNWQNCHNQIFASLDFSFEGLYQGIRRSWRFGQEYPVNIYIITTDTMSNVIESIKIKEKQFEDMQQEMTNAANSANKDIRPDRPYKELKTDSFNLRLGDCVELIKQIPDESIGLSVFSPPFAELYTYSDQLEDMGNSKDYNEFFNAFNFLVKDLFRVLQSGRNVCVHCMDLPIQKGKEGYIGLRDFSGMILQSFADAGFIYHSRITIWKNPVTEMQRTKALGLLHKQIKKDAAMSRVGIPDYILVFRKPGESNNPVIHNDKDNSRSDYLPVDLWQKYASPVWLDVDYSNTLNKMPARDGLDEKHIAPLQLETIDRLIHLYSNEGDTVLTPFAGIGSEVYQSIKNSRKAIGFELKESYWKVACDNCKQAEEESKRINTVDLFLSRFNSAGV